MFQREGTQKTKTHTLYSVIFFPPKILQFIRLCGKIL